jgi:hypothetical protein
MSVAMISAVLPWQTTRSRAEEQRPCIVAQDIKTFCSSRSTVSYIAKVPQASKWLSRFVKTRASGFGLYESARDIPDEARVTISCDHESEDQPATMFLWHETIGTIGLAYSMKLGPKGLIFSMVDPGSRRSASGTTPGTFAIVNMCQLGNDYINGLLFMGNQPIPLWFFGRKDERSSSSWPADTEVSASNATSSGATADPRQPVASDTSPDASPSVAIEFDRLKFSGIYEFDTEDEVCLVNNGLMKVYDKRPASEKLGKLPADPGRAVSREVIRSWERSCPPLKGRLVVVAADGCPPIYNLDHGTHVSHHVIGGEPVIIPNLDKTYRFQSLTPNGDTTGPNNGMFKIDGTFYPQDGSLEFFVVRPNLGMTGRLRPLDRPAGRPMIWETFKPFHASKRLDFYCKIGLRSEKDCDGMNKEWDGYLLAAWNQHEKLMNTRGRH